MPRTINVIQSFYAARTFTQAMQPEPGELIVHEDVLSCGPLPPIRSIEEWTQLRKAYWDSIASSKERRPFNADLLSNAAALRDADSIVLWLGMGAAEQLMFAWMVQYLKLIGSRAQLHSIQFEHVGNAHWPIWGTGLLEPDQMRHHPPAEPVSAQTIVELERLWERVTSPDPSSLLEVLAGKSVYLPHIPAALTAHLLRFPDYRTGLGRWEAELLRCTKEVGPKAARIIGEVMGVNFDADLVGDGVLFSRLHNLASPNLSHPLVTLSGDPDDIQKCQVALTPMGESVIAGQTNAVDLNGINDWVLGVHLDSSSGSVWYLKDRTLVTR